MKWFAPRCNDGRFVISLSAGRCQPACPPSLADAAPAPDNSAKPTRMYLLVRIVGHSIWNRAVAVPLGDEEERDEEAEVQHREDARQKHVDAVGRLQPQPHEHEERHEEDTEQDLRGDASVADRLVLSAIDP